MLIDFVVRSKEELPQKTARSLAESGIDCVVFDVNDSAFSKALDAEGIIGIPGVALTHETSFLMALPVESPECGVDSIEAWQDTMGEIDGIAVASHPYDRDNGRPWGDRIYKLKGVTHVCAPLRTVSASRNQLAEHAAQKLDLGHLTFSLGNQKLRGQVATCLVTQSSERSAIVDALRENKTLGCSIQDASSEYSPIPDPPRFAASDDRRARGPRQGRNDRGNGRSRRDGRRR